MVAVILLDASPFAVSALVVLVTLPFILFPLASKETAVPFLVASGVLGGFGGVAYNITLLSFRQAICPERMQAG